MEIRRYLPDVDQWASLHLERPDRKRLLRQLFGTGPLEIADSAVIVDTSYGPFPDFIRIGVNAPVVSENAWSAIQAICSDCEPHRIYVPGADRQYLILRIPTVPILDENAAAVRREADGYVYLEAYAFKPIPPGFPSLFYVPESKYLHILATQKFIDCVNEHELTGLIFPKLLMADDK